MSSARKTTTHLEIFVALLIVGATVAILTPVVLAQSDRNRACAENVNALVLAFNQYIQDYDETIPMASVWNNPARFQTELSLYVGSTRPFRCPATGAGYTTNPAIAGQSFSAFDSDTTELFRDARAHADGKSTVAFLGGFIERGGVEQYFPDADAECYRRARAITFAIGQYTQDYDGRLPFQTNDTEFRSVVQPYLGSGRLWVCPDTKVNYNIAQGFRGKSVADFSDFDAVEVVRDTTIHRSEVSTISYLSGYAEQRGPRGVKYPIPVNESRTRLGKLGLALLSYSQDYDEKLPPVTTIAALKPLLFPYMRAGRVFEPPVDGGVPFQLNPTVGGTNLYDYPNVSQVEWIRDNNSYGDGLVGVGFLDGHVERRAP